MIITDDEYKRAKEAFVADIQGTTGREVFFVFALMPVRLSSRVVRSAGGIKWLIATLALWHQGTQWLYSELMLLLEVAGLRSVGSGDFVRCAFRLVRAMEWGVKLTVVDAGAAHYHPH
jgi:hypothetical protein